MTRFSLLLLCGLLSHVNAGAVCKEPCQTLTAKEDGTSIQALTLANTITADCADMDTIECPEGHSCYYTQRDLRAESKAVGVSNENGIFVDIGCHASDITVAPCSMYDEFYPMDLGSVVIEKDQCVIYKDDQIPRSGLGLEPESEPDEEEEEEQEEEEEPEEEEEEEAEPEEPIKCNVCTDVVKVDADGVDETVAVEGAASCSDASVVECPAEVTSCASITVTYTDSEGVNFRRSQKACREAALDCDSLKVELDGSTVTDCDVADTPENNDPENIDTEGNDTEKEEETDENYEIENEVEEEAVKGSSATLSSVFIVITLTQLW